MMIPSCFLPQYFLAMAYLTSTWHIKPKTANISAPNKNKVQSTLDETLDTNHRHPSFEEWQDLQQPSLGFLTLGNERSRHQAFWPVCLDRCHPAFRLLEEKKSELSLNSAFATRLDQSFQKKGFRSFRKETWKAAGHLNHVGKKRLCF